MRGRQQRPSLHEQVYDFLSRKNAQSREAESELPIEHEDCRQNPSQLPAEVSLEEQGLGLRLGPRTDPPAKSIKTEERGLLRS